MVRRGALAGVGKGKGKAEAPAADPPVASAGAVAPDGDGEEHRFQHLLEPIRDLAMNWCVSVCVFERASARGTLLCGRASCTVRSALRCDAQAVRCRNLDIAHELENYLEQLEGVQVSLDGGITMLNFAEAALLIQGTTCVYSRKVEYLHRLVMQVLDVIDHKLAKELRKDAPANDDDAEGAFPADPEFISLDDIPEAKDEAINMKEGGAGLEDDELGGPLVVMMNIEVDTDNTDPNKDLRLSNAVMHESGALLLDPGAGAQLDMNLLPRKHSLNSSTLINASTLSPERLRADTSDLLQGVPGGAVDDGVAEGGMSPPQMEAEVNYSDDSDHEQARRLSLSLSECACVRSSARARCL